MRCRWPMLLAEPISIIHLFFGVTSEFYRCHLFILLCLLKFTWAPFIHTSFIHLYNKHLLLYQVIFGLIAFYPGSFTPHILSPLHSPPSTLQAFSSAAASHLSGSLFPKCSLWLSCSFHSGAFSNATCQGTLSWLFCTKLYISTNPSFCNLFLDLF